MQEENFGKVSYVIDNRRRIKEKEKRAAMDIPHPALTVVKDAAISAEEITPTEAFSIASGIIATSNKSGFAEYIGHKQKSLSSGEHFLALVLLNNPQNILEQELRAERRQARELKRLEIFDALNEYKKNSVHIITPKLVAAAEECVRRLAGNIEKK
ncbi:MAG: hypothetical protein Q7S08_02780 [bacterium]|nr:hypothetical protein [bacterium]